MACADLRQTVGRVATVVVLACLGGADWPAYQHDNGRTGVTSERLSLPLGLDWQYRPGQPPARGWAEPEENEVWSYGVERIGRVRYDDAPRPVAAAGLAVFASSGENKVVAIDAASGVLRWTFYTDSPVRLTPTISNGHVLFGCDDGLVYCLEASDGSPVWTFHAAPAPERVLGQGKMISRWPVRTGVLVADGTAYFAAGLFPAEGLYLYAVDAADGRKIWANDTFDAGGTASISPQGYLVASEDRLFVPSGRVTPAVFRRDDGRLLYQVESAWGLTGGSDALVAGGLLFNGSEMVTAYDLDRGKPQFYWFGGRRLIVDGNAAFVATDDELLSLPVASLPAASREVHKLREAAWNNRNGVRAYRQAEADLAAAAPDSPQRDRLVERLRQNEPAFDAWQAELQRVEAYLDQTCAWRRKCHASDALILAGDTLFAGGAGRVIAVNHANGRETWTADVDGAVRGLTASDGRLLVGTTNGNVYCFAADAAGTPKQIAASDGGASSPDDETAEFCRRTAERIAQQVGSPRGYCLILGSRAGGLAAEIAARTELAIHVVDPDAESAAQSRRLLDRAGLYGGRVTVQHAALDAVEFPPFWANVIVSTEGFFGGTVHTPPAELVRMLRPGTGVAFIGQPPGGERLGKRLDPADVAGWLQQLDRSTADADAEAVWVCLKRKELAGAGQWSHQYADAGNTASSEDRLAEAPFGVLWYGDPGPRHIIERHARPPAPLCVAGRMFILGRGMVMAYDAYNGLPLWQHDLPGSQRQGLPLESGSIAATRDSLFVLVEDRCLRLDAADGGLRQTYTVPARDDGRRRRWGWLAVTGDMLLGSRTESDRPFKDWPEPQNHASEAVFALDLATGDTKWIHQGAGIMNTSIAAGGGRVFLLDKQLTEGQREQAIRERLDDMQPAEPARPDRKGRVREPDLRLAVALDASDGSTRWSRPLDVTECVVGPEARPVAGGEINLIYKDDVLLLCSAPWNGHFLEEFKAGKFSRRSIVALDAADGHVLWSGHKGYRSRPLVIGRTIYAEPWAYDLRTGEAVLRHDPHSGKTEPWDMWRGYGGCGALSASATTLFFRAGSIGYYDLKDRQGVVQFGGQRPGCWINLIAAGGLVLMPEGSSECVCPYPIQCSLAWYPRKTDSVGFELFRADRPPAD